MIRWKKSICMYLQPSERYVLQSGFPLRRYKEEMMYMKKSSFSCIHAKLMDAFLIAACLIVSLTGNNALASEWTAADMGIISQFLSESVPEGSMYSLDDLNSDEIPELKLQGDNGFYTFVGGKAIHIVVSGNAGLEGYFRTTGILKYTDYSYGKITNMYFQLLGNTFNRLLTDVDFSSFYSWNGKSVSQKDYVMLLDNYTRSESLTPVFQTWYQNTAGNRAAYQGNQFGISGSQSPVQNGNAYWPSNNTGRKKRYSAVIMDCSWTEAFWECRKTNGQLARFETEQEYQDLVDYLSSVPSFRDIVFFVGGRREMNEQSYHWVDENNKGYGDVLNAPGCSAFSHWQSYEPTYRDGNTIEHVLTFYQKNGVWGLNDDPDHLIDTSPTYYKGRVGFICEYPNNGGKN